MPIRRLPSIHAGGCGSGSGPGTYSSSGSNFVFAMIGYSVIPVPILPQFINFIFYHIDRNPIFVGRQLPAASKRRSMLSFPQHSLLRSDRPPALLHSAHAIPSGSFPVSNVVVTSSFFKSTTATLLSPLTATNTLKSSGAIKIPSALFPSFSRFTSFRVPASITSNSPLPKSEISTHLPLGVNFTRFECLVPTFTVSVTFFVVVSIIVTVPSPEPAAHTSIPSGEMSIPSGPLPVGITVLNHFCLSGEATTAVTESEFTFDV